MTLSIYFAIALIMAIVLLVVGVIGRIKLLMVTPLIMFGLFALFIFVLGQALSRM